jgi:hypothetical protein
MPKRAVSVTLDESNLVWLKGVTERSGARSLSETLDRIVTAAREDGTAARNAAHSVVGTIDISAADPSLDEADGIVRDLFARSLARPMLAKEARAALQPGRARRG